MNTLFKKLIKNKILSQLSLVIIGNTVAAGFGALAVLMVSRELTVSDFGLFTTALSLMITTSSLTDIGTTQSMMTFASSLLGEGKYDYAAKIFRIALFVRLGVTLIVAVLILSTSEFLATKVLNYPNLVLLFKLTALGVLGISMFLFIKAVYQTHQLFNISVSLQLLVDVFKLLAVSIIVILFNLNLVVAFLIFVFSSAVGALVGFWKLRHKLVSNTETQQNLIRPLFSFSKWVFMTNASSIIIPSVGIFMIVWMLGSDSAGIYGLAHNLTYIFPILIGSLVTVLLPEVSKFGEVEQFRSYLRTSLKISIILIICIIPVLLFSGDLISYFFGNRYIGAVPVFKLLMISGMIAIVNSIIRVCLYPLNKPHIVTFTSLVALIILVLGCYILIPILGVISPALLLVFISVSNFVFLYFYVYRRIQKGNIKFQEIKFEYY